MYQMILVRFPFHIDDLSYILNWYGLINELLFLFDLKTPEIYQRTIKDDGKVKTSRSPIFPEEWKNQFGLPVEEHRNALRVNIFDGYAVFGLEKDKKDSKEEPSPNDLKGETDYEQINLSSY